jgi:hypothetical protein
MSGAAYCRADLPTIAPVDPAGARNGAQPGDQNPSDQNPGVPSRRVVLLAFTGVVVAGLLGAGAAWGIADIDCRGACDTSAALAAVVGALVGAIGGGVVAVLVLRARSQWRVPHDEA